MKGKRRLLEPRAGIGRNVFERGHGRGSALSFRGLDPGIGEREEKLFEGPGVGLPGRLAVVGQGLAQRGIDLGQRFAQAVRADLDRHGDRLFVEPGPQRPGCQAGQQQRDDPVATCLAALLDLESLLDLAAHPRRIDRARAEDGEEVRGLLDGLLDLRRELVATSQVAGVNPDGNLERFELLTELGDEGVVRGGVRDEEGGHASIVKKRT